MAADTRLGGDELRTFGRGTAWLEGWPPTGSRGRAQLIGRAARLARRDRRIHGHQRDGDARGEEQTQHTRDMAGRRRDGVAMGMVEQSSAAGKRDTGLC